MGQDWEGAFLHCTYKSDLWTGDGQEAAEIFRKAYSNFTIKCRDQAKESPLQKSEVTLPGSAQGKRRRLKQGPEVIDISGKQLNAQMRERQ